ncbi:hypothetical protein BG003_010397 [Podila horticola]|nr:hypothetical protein BG003_010397 [Podila horticola]
MSLKKQGHGQIGLLFQQPIDTSHIFWTDLASYLSDELKKFQEGSGDRALGTLRWILDEHKISGLAGINVFSHNGNCWEGQLTVKGGRYYGVEQVSIPSTRFSASDLECGLLRRLVLNCYHAKDMLQALSLIKSNPLLLSIDLPAERCNVSASIESIRQKCYGRVLPLEVTSLDYHGTVLAKVVIRSKDDSVSLEASTHSQSTPTIDVLEWRLDQVSTRLRDYDVQLLESASQVIPSLLINLTLDITALTAQGLANLCIVLQRSTLEHLHIKCVPFIPYYGASVGSVLRAIQWPTIKSLVLTGNNIDDWLQVWGSNGDLFDLAGSWFATSAFGPCLSSLHVIASDMNENELSHASALAIQHLVYSSRLVELHLKNVVLQESRDWDLVLGGIHYAKLKKIALQNCNIPESQRRKAVVGRPFLSIKDRVGGWMRNTF